MNHYRELVYVNAHVMPAGASISHEQLFASDWELWLVPGRSHPFDVWQVAAPIADTPGTWRLSAPVIQYDITMLPNPAFMSPEWTSFIDMVWSTCPNKRQFFEVDMLEHWLPVVQRRLLLERTLSEVGFYAMYDVIEDTRRDEEGENRTSLDFNFAGELDLSSFCVTNVELEMQVLKLLRNDRFALNQQQIADHLSIQLPNEKLTRALTTLKRDGLVLAHDMQPPRYGISELVRTAVLL